MGNIPRIYKDEDYLIDIEKEKLKQIIKICRLEEVIEKLF